MDVIWGDLLALMVHEPSHPMVVRGFQQESQAVSSVSIHPSSEGRLEVKAKSDFSLRARRLSWTATELLMVHRFHNRDPWR